jgi:hypothetical protein
MESDERIQSQLQPVYVGIIAGGMFWDSREDLEVDRHVKLYSFCNYSYRIAYIHADINVYIRTAIS